MSTARLRRTLPKRSLCACLVGLFLLTFGGVKSAKSEEPAPPPLAVGVANPFELAPDGEWPMQDGCPARTRATATRLPLGTLEVAWTYEAPATIVGDPCITGECVFVGTGPDEKGVSYLEVLRLSDGKPVVPKRKDPKGQPVRLGAWRDVVVVPAGPEEMEALRVLPEQKKLVSLGKFAGARDPVMVEGGVVTVTAREIHRFEFGHASSVWTRPLGGTPLGPPTVGGDSVFVVTTRSVEGYVGTRAQLEIVALDGQRDSVRTHQLGWEPDRGGSQEESTIVAGRDELFVTHPRGFVTADHSVVTGTRIPVMQGILGDSHLVQFLGQTVVWGPAAVVRRGEKSGERVLLMSRPELEPKGRLQGGWKWYPLAAFDRQPELLESGGPAVIADGIVLLPGGMFELASRRLLEVHRVPKTARRIPVRETLLEVEGRKIVAWRRAKGSGTHRRGPVLPAAAEAKPVDVVAGAVVTWDGAVRLGSFQNLAAEGAVAASAKERIAHSDIGLLLDGEGKIVHGPDPLFVVRRLPAATGAMTRTEWLALAKKSVATRSAEVLAKTIDQLALRGGRSDDMAPLRKELDKLEHPQGAPPKIDKAKVADVERQRDALLARETAAYARAVLGLPDDVSLDYRAPLLRALLAAAPAHPEAVAWLRTRLPAGFDPKTEVAPTDWLDFLQASSHAPFTVLPPKPEGGTLTLDERVHGSLRTTWRPDLVALRSERLLLVTPVAKPSRIARCLSLGELVCSTLDELFGLKGDQLRLIDPLHIQLFETQEEYLARSEAANHGGESGRSSLAWTSGHYDVNEGISRLYVPPGDDRFDGVVETLAHELTHHWLDQRMPPPEGAKRTTSSDTSPCYFLEEGFATMVEEFSFDIEARTFRTPDPLSVSLDTVLNAPELIPWVELIEMTHKGMLALPKVNALKVPCRWVLGVHRVVSRTHLFYAQSATICHYLWNAQDGKNRAVLREWIRDLHANRLKPGETKRRLSIPPEQLGRDAMAWAREISGPK